MNYNAYFELVLLFIGCSMVLASAIFLEITDISTCCWAYTPASFQDSLDEYNINHQLFRMKRIHMKYENHHHNMGMNTINKQRSQGNIITCKVVLEVRANTSSVCSSSDCHNLSLCSMVRKADMTIAYIRTEQK